MQTLLNLIRYTKQIHKERWDFPLDTIVVKDFEFESLAKDNYCFIEGVRIIPESAMLEDSLDYDIEVDLGNWAALLRK
jgi:hypothetical protein